FYVTDEWASVSRPPKELKAFAKVRLDPGQSRAVTVSLDTRALAFFDVAQLEQIRGCGLGKTTP
ncbi:MAG TPA: fibronectin type III-like domain-contianing protein, partial [Casimicrobiaceae bacterium]|nr:fibronectin type III-like domain-contianing protein [Casimicrobiaceae bacterium]